MKNRELDNILKGKLERIKPDYNPASWDRLAATLDKEIASEQSNLETFDQNVKQKLNQYSVPYQENHWSLFSVKLDQVFILRRNLYLFKFIEVTLMSLLLLLLIQYLPNNNSHLNDNQNQFDYFPKSSPSTNTTDKEPIAAVTNSESKSIVHEVEPDFSSPSKNTYKNALPSNQLVTKNSINPSVLADSYQLEQQWGNSQLSSEKNLKIRTTQNDNLDQIKTIGSISPSVKSIRHNENLSLLAQADEILQNPKLGGTTTMNTFALLPSLIGELSSSIDQNAELKIITPIKKKAGLRIGMYGSTDFNRIVTPPNPKERLYERLIRYGLGYSGGISIGFEKGRWEVETGAAYSSKSHNPRSVLFIEGSFKEGYQVGGVKYSELDILQVPLNFKYFFVYRNKWRLYTMGGASLNIVSLAHYHAADQTGFPGFRAQPVPSNAYAPGTSPTKVIKEQKDFEEGWLEGGSLRENSYFTLNGGIGIERYFSPKFSLFFQPTYQQNFNLLPGFVTNEIGPNKESFSSMSLLMGLRVRVTN